MHALAAYVLKGRAQAALAIAALAIVSWAFSLMSLLSAAAVALPTLRKGAIEGAVTVAIALPLVAVAGWMLLGNPLQAVEYGLVLWGPVWLAAILLRESGQLTLTLIGATVLGLLMVIGIYVINDNPAAMWLEELQKFFQPLLDKRASDVDVEMFRRGLAEFARYLTGAIAAGSVLTLIFSLLVARWWQAMLFNPGGFRAEFLGLRMPSVIAYLWLGLLALAWATAGDSWAEVAANLAIPLFVPFLLAGFSILHALLSGSTAGRFWLTGIYVALLFVSPLAVMIVLVGISDTWIDWRNRFLQA
jgi:hypothetical protein